MSNEVTPQPTVKPAVMDQDAKLGFLRNCFDTQTYPNYFLDAVLRKYDGDVIAAVKSLAGKQQDAREHYLHTTPWAWSAYRTLFMPVNVFVTFRPDGPARIPIADVNPKKGSNSFVWSAFLDSLIRHSAKTKKIMSKSKIQVMKRGPDGEVEVTSFDFIDGGEELFVQERESRGKRKAALKVQLLLKNRTDWITNQSAFWAARRVRIQLPLTKGITTRMLSDGELSDRHPLSDVKDDYIHVCLTREGAAQNNFLLSKRGKARHRQELQNAVKGKYPKADTVGSPDEEKFFVQFWTKVFTEKYKSLASGYFHDPQKNQQELIERLKEVHPTNCLLRPELEKTWPLFDALSGRLVDDMLEIENRAITDPLEERLKEAKFRREARWKNVNLHSEMILKQKELNAAKTAPRYAGSKAGNAVKMRSTPLNVSRKRVQELLAINAGLDRTSRPLHDMAQQNPHRGPPGTELQVKNALSFRKNGSSLLNEALKDNQETERNASKTKDLDYKWLHFLNKASVRVAEMLRQLFANSVKQPKQLIAFRDEATRLLRVIDNRQKKNKELKAYANAFRPIDNQLQIILDLLRTQNDQVPLKRPRH